MSKNKNQEIVLKGVSCFTWMVERVMEMDALIRIQNNDQSILKLYCCFNPFSEELLSIKKGRG